MDYALTARARGSQHREVEALARARDSSAPGRQRVQVYGSSCPAALARLVASSFPPSASGVSVWRCRTSSPPPSIIPPRVQAPTHGQEGLTGLTLCRVEADVKARQLEELWALAPRNQVLSIVPTSAQHVPLRGPQRATEEERAMKIERKRECGWLAAAATPRCLGFPVSISIFLIPALTAG